MSKRTPRQALAPALALLLVALAPACGGGTTLSDSTSTTAEAPESEQVEPIDAIAVDLEAVGLSTYPEDPVDGQGAIATGPDSNRRWVQVTYYDDAAQAAMAGREVAAVYAEFPGKGMVKVIDHLFVKVGSPRPLTSEERTAFKEVVAILKGRG